MRLSRGRRGPRDRTAILLNLGLVAILAYFCTVLAAVRLGPLAIVTADLPLLLVAVLLATGRLGG